MNGITGPRDSVIRFAYLMELAMGYASDCIDVGDGIVEERDEFTHIYQVITFRSDPSNEAFAAIVPDGCEAADSAVRQAYPTLASVVSNLGPLPELQPYTPATYGT